MEHYSIVILLLGVMICLSAVADAIRIPYPILLILGGIAVGFIPSVPVVELDPEVIFLIFLPPLLYDSAFNIRAEDFRTHFNTISTLAISLIFLTTTAIAAVAYFLIPGMTWPLAFVLGSILSATDAVSAISITKGLGLPHKMTTILEGESLINDASALVAYKYAVLAVGGSAFIFWRASLQFVAVMGGGVLIGMLAGRLLGVIINRVKNNNMVAISFMLLIPFVTYRIAEELHVSGVLAVVVLGIAMARFSTVIFPDHLRQQSKSFWDVIIFLLNGLIFILIGLQLPYVIRALDMDLILPYVGYGLLITLVAFGVRLLRVFLQQINLARAFQSKRGRHRISESALLDFKTCMVVSWSGMRGIVSLATAIGLPMLLEDGTAFPERSAIIFISVVVVLMTIVGQGLSLPWLVRKLKIKKDEHAGHIAKT